MWVHIPGDNPKIYNRPVESILVGYSDSLKAYRCLHRLSGRIHVTRNVVFAESQDLRERPLHPGVTVGEAGTNPHDDGEMRRIHTACLPQIKEDVPELPEITSHPPEAMLRRSTRISELSKNSPEKSLGTYMQVIDTTPEGYVHFSFNNDEWCNLGNEDDPISYRDAFS